MPSNTGFDGYRQTAGPLLRRANYFLRELRILYQACAGASLFNIFVRTTHVDIYTIETEVSCQCCCLAHPVRIRGIKLRYNRPL